MPSTMQLYYVDSKIFIVHVTFTCFLSFFLHHFLVFCLTIFEDLNFFFKNMLGKFIFHYHFICENITCLFVFKILFHVQFS
jgi:hypothetical protein